MFWLIALHVLGGIGLIGSTYVLLCCLVIDPFLERRWRKIIRAGTVFRITHAWVDTSRWVRYGRPHDFRLVTEMHQWCKENCCKPYVVFNFEAHTFKIDSREYHVAFVSDADAALFKLTWL